jgi:ribosomal protein S18 acetylase RimI-like enzyme
MVAAVTTRELEPDNRQAVLGLAERLCIGVASWRDPGLVAAAVRGWVEDSVVAAGNGDSELFVAVTDRVVGFVSVGQREHFTGEVDAYVGELVVDGSVERQGVGRALMQRAQSWARDRGLTRLTLETGAANRMARVFYAELGYEEEDVRLTRALSLTNADHRRGVGAPGYDAAWTGGAQPGLGIRQKGWPWGSA